eukprot:5007785-Prymnesium_polylepis.2
MTAWRSAEWLSVARCSAAPCCTSGCGDAISVHSVGIATACRSRDASSSAVLLITDIAQHCNVALVVLARNRANRDSSLAFATCAHAEALADASSASSERALFCADSERSSWSDSSLMRPSSDLLCFFGGSRSDGADADRPWR